MVRYKLKKMTALLMAATLTLGLAACGNSGNSASSTTGLYGPDGSLAVGNRNKAATAYEYAAPGVTLPADFDIMLLPITAHMLQDYAKGLEYYYSDVDPGQEDSVWYAMAALNSLMIAAGNQLSEKAEDGYWYMDKASFDICLAALYDEFGCGYMDPPALPAQDTYAVYDSIADRYGFIEGDAGGLYPYITECVDEEGSYNLLIELRRDLANGEYETLREMYFDIYETSYVAMNNIFPYSISDAYRTDDIEDEDDYMESDETGLMYEDSSDEDDSSEEDNLSTPLTSNPGASGRNNSSNSFFNQDTLQNIDTSGGNVSLDEAQHIAELYYGSGVEYIYQGMETVDEESYYLFGVSNADDTYVLVSEEGQTVLTGVRDASGSWMFQ